ncbi:MAG: hypothetical protein P8048_03045 [Calditrichia bacterium]
MVIHAGVGKAVDIGFDETPQDIPSLFLTSAFLFNTLGVSGITVDNGAVTVNDGMILPETESQVGIELGLNGIFTSNFGSQLGWLDLFSPETRRTGIGRFGLMDAGLFNGDGLLPALPCAWTRLRSGWEDWVNLYYSPNDELTIHSTLSSDPDRVYRIPIACSTSSLSSAMSFQLPGKSWKLIFPIRQHSALAACSSMWIIRTSAYPEPAA